MTQLHFFTGNVIDAKALPLSYLHDDKFLKSSKAFLR